MEIFSEEGAALLARWTHFLAGITWIGLLYYFNFVQGPAFATFEAAARGEATRKLVPRALWWFRYSALLTWMAGVSLILIFIQDIGLQNWDDLLFSLSTSDYGIKILVGMTLGTIMLLNVWGVIWPNQKIVIASAEKAAAGGEADPRAADCARRALLTSRTNVIFSIPMLFFMATAQHLRLFDAEVVTNGERVLFFVLAAVVVAWVELNALSGLTGPTKKPLEKVSTTIWSGFVLFGVLYVALQVITRSP